MASTILTTGLQKTAVDMTHSTNSKKVKDLAPNMKNAEDEKARITSDFGVKETTADDWLKVVNEDKTGPLLLEDPFAREKVFASPAYIPNECLHLQRL